MKNSDACFVAREQSDCHQGGDQQDQTDIEEGSRSYNFEDWRCSGFSTRNVYVGVIADEPGRAADLLHDCIAGVDAKPALDAIELQAISDVYTCRADKNALLAIDAVAPG